VCCLLRPIKIKKKENPPAYSLAAGYDYGSPVALGLEPLTPAEALPISLVRPDMVVIKLPPTSGTDQLKLRGRVVSFDQEGPREFAKQLPDVGATHSVLRVWFVGPKGDTGVWRKGVTACDGLTVDCAKVVKWLQVLKKINPYYKTVSTSEDVASLKLEVKKALDHVVNSAEWTAEEKFIQLEKASCL